MMDHMHSYLKLRNYKMDDQERTSIIRMLQIVEVGSWKAVYEEPDLPKRFTLMRALATVVTQKNKERELAAQQLKAERDRQAKIEQEFKERLLESVGP